MSGAEIASLERELALVQQLVVSDEAKLAVSDNPIIEKIFLSSSSKLLHDLQRKVYEAKAERAYELVRLRLIGNQMTGSIPLRTLVKLVAPLNHLLERCSWRVWDKDGDAKKMDDKFSGLLDLRLEGINLGSTELVIMGNISPDLTGVSALESGLRNVFSLLNAKNEDVSDYVNDLGFLAAKAMSDLLSELDKHSIAAELQWNAPGKYLCWEGRPNEIIRIKTILEDIGEPVTELITVRGKVQVLSVRNRIEILITQQEIPVKIVASFHHSMLEDIQDLRLGDTRDFLIEKTTYPFSMSKKKKVAYRLKEIHFMDVQRVTDEI